MIQINVIHAHQIVYHVLLFQLKDVHLVFQLITFIHNNVLVFVQMDIMVMQIKYVKLVILLAKLVMGH